MITLHFDPRASLIRLRATLEFRYRKAALLVFDPGASLTAITPQLAEALGCAPANSHPNFPIYTAGGASSAPRLKLTSLSLYGERIEAVDVLCLSLPRGLGAEGLLGLNVLRQFKISLDFEDGILTFSRIQTVR